ncbi:MAG: DNA methyltransferase [Dehalococcoidales bacterium]|nr:DNA methyltransferase [Dehalococcoidales bacterium]
MPGGTKLSFGIFLNNRLLGAVTFGVGPFLAYRLVKEATPEDCICLTRLWLSDELPSNSESRILGILNRYLHRYTDLKFIIAYSDPSAKHVGTVYQAGGWLYTGLSSSMPLYNVGDGRPRHSRTLAHSLGSHSIRYLSQHGLYVKLVAQLPKHRYIKFLDDSWRCRLLVPVLPYPKREKVVSNEIN